MKQQVKSDSRYILLATLGPLLVVAVFVASQNKDGSAPRPPDDASGSPVSISIPPRLARQKACLQRSGFDWRPPPSSNSSTWQVMSVPETQLSPSGFQRRTSWVIGSRQTRFGRLPANTAWGDTELPPQSVFVRTDLLQAFFHRVLPCISNRSVLLVGDHDATTPRQVDVRYPEYLNHRVWAALLANPRIAHIFVENLDSMEPHFAGRVSALPRGIDPAEFRAPSADDILRHQPHRIDMVDRRLAVLLVDRQWAGPQWAEWARARALCTGDWAGFCVTNSTSPGPAFFALLRTFPFVLCPHGGGVDPAPRTWEALLMGAISILRRFPGAELYRGLPVVFLDSWTLAALSTAMLQTWRQQLAPHFTDPAKRAEVLHRLGADFWWEKVQAGLEGPGRLSKFESNVSTLAVNWREDLGSPPPPTDHSSWHSQPDYSAAPIHR